MNTTETFIPYNQYLSYLLVDFVEMQSSKDPMDHDIMVVEFNKQEYKLRWDPRYSYFAGYVASTEGYIP